MPNLDYQHHQPVILHFAERAIVSDAITPDARSVTDESFASHTRVVEFSYFGKVLNDSSCHVAIELSELLKRDRGERDAIGQARA